MSIMSLHRFQGVLLCTIVLSLTILLSACSGVANGTGPSTTGTTATTTTTTTATQVPPAATQAAVPTTAAVAFKAGGISFIGPVKSITSSSLSHERSQRAALHAGDLCPD